MYHKLKGSPLIIAFCTVTGGAGVLALAAARALLEHGLIKLTILDLPKALKASTDAINALDADFPHARIRARPLDVTNPDAVTKSFVRAAEVMGGVDQVLCFAGVVGCTHAMEMSANEWSRTMEVNSTGSFLCAQAGAKVMSSQRNKLEQEKRGKRKGGSIVLTASISAHRVNFPQPQVAYNVSKAAVLSMAKSLGAEWAR